MKPGHHRALVALGSNLNGPLGTPRDYVVAALTRLEATEGVKALRHSRLYRTAAWGRSDQDDFINAVAEFSCSLEPGDLLNTLLKLEQELGRRRTERWGPRLIDLDLLTCDDIAIDSERLTLPHPRMHERAFVLVPVLELDPWFEIPGIGRADACLAALGGRQQVEPL